ncbi:hypothetical protein ANCCEY_11803 [Ancylostoma ceylanicum]|uniref:Endonuclease/exonuclease/phosphatase domain-containing protein n=1 Tax=Ancylostoma ceylanicum TaxID=53326 RepID=A0A0D6LCY3_9BILA|nr:hypothetical protein ANCCEY_11803 [Ancylostoma ceylanicum]
MASVASKSLCGTTQECRFFRNCTRERKNLDAGNAPPWMPSQAASSSVSWEKKTESKINYRIAIAKRNGVAIAVSGPLKAHVSSVNRISDRIISLRIATKDGFWTVISVYAPQCGCTDDDKEAFYEGLDDVIRSAPEGDYMTVAGDFDGHVGQDRQGFERVDGGIGFGRRNQEGERIIELAEAHDLAIASTFFIKRGSEDCVLQRRSAK